MDNKQKAQLVGQAHNLNPVVMIGNKGLTSNVIAEADQALTAHELIKIKISADDKQQRLQIAEELCTALQAEYLKQIGNIAIIYRKNPD